MGMLQGSWGQIPKMVWSVLAPRIDTYLENSEICSLAVVAVTCYDAYRYVSAQVVAV